MPDAKEQLYVLSHRRDNAEEDRRLDSQHQVIQHAILSGRLFHPSIVIPSSKKKPAAIADLGCGTGIWLEDVARTVFETEKLGNGDELPTLVGFDVNSHAFKVDLAPGVRLVEHDCTRGLGEEWGGRFDVVNVRGLSFALNEGGLRELLRCAEGLLRPGGYLQWLETDPRLWKSSPETSEIDEALDLVHHLRERRELALNMPAFMLRHFAGNAAQNDMTLVNYSLFPGGLARIESNPSAKEEVELNDKFSDIVLESLALVLGAVKATQAEAEQTRTEELVEFIGRVRWSGEVKMSGWYPFVVARKN